MAQRPIVTTGCKSLSKFTELNNLTAGAKVLFATDDFFAEAENLLKESNPEWKEGVFVSTGKWMDGWETRRKRIPGHDWCLIKLPFTSVIHGVDVDTSYFTGNFTPRISIQAARLSPSEEDFIPPRPGGASNIAASEQEMILVARVRSEEWETIVPDENILGAGYADTCHNLLSVESREPWTHIRLNCFPDGGIARLRIFGQVLRTLTDIKNSSSSDHRGLLDLLAMEHGGICIGFSNAHYGHPKNMILKRPCPTIGDGWETARRLDRLKVITVDHNGMLESPGCEWAAFRLGIKGRIIKVDVDTACFKGNFPDSCKIEGCNLTKAKDEANVLNDKIQGAWSSLVPLSKLGADKKHIFTVGEKESSQDYTHVRITIAPDGGVARFRVWGKPSDD